MELLQQATSVAMLIFVLSSMLAMGLGLTVSQIITPLRHARLVVLSLRLCCKNYRNKREPLWIITLCGQSE